jgi:putative ABC transport system permease protein
MMSLALTVSFVSSSYRLMKLGMDLQGRRTCNIRTDISPFVEGNGSKHHLDLEDLKALRERFGGVALFLPYSGSTRTLSRDGRHVKSFVLGSDPSAVLPEESWRPIVLDGRLVEMGDIEGLSRVCVLNPVAKEALFGSDRPIGKEIRVGEMPFTVIGAYDDGVAQKLGFKGKNSVILIPMTTCMRRLLNVTALNMLSFYVQPGNDTEAVANQVADLLRKRHGIVPPRKDDFRISTPGQAQQAFDEEMHEVRAVAALIVGLAFLLAAGVLTQVQWLSINHRRTEIGVRRALGATQGGLSLDFIWESLLITACGSILGLLLTAASLPVIHRVFYEEPDNYSAGSLFSPFTHMLLDGWVLAACVVATLFIGLAAGVLPARRAARIDPVEALR